MFDDRGFYLAIYLQVLPDLFHTVRTCDDYLKDYITWKLGTLVSIVRQVDIDVVKLFGTCNYSLAFSGYQYKSDLMFFCSIFVNICKNCSL